MLIDVAYLKKAKQLHLNIERAKLEKAYVKRTELIEQIQSQIDGTLTKGIKSGKLDAKEMNKLKRQLKAVISTDPTAYKSHDAWKKSVLKPDIEGKLQAHHKLGLDDYVDYMADMDTDELIDFHRQAARRGYYFGNHPENLEWLAKDQHVGQGTRLASGRDAVHGRYEHSRLDQYKAKDLSGSDQLAEIIHGNPDVGQPGSFDEIPRKRFDVPENIRDLPFNEKVDSAFYFAGEDMESIELAKATPRKPQIIKGHSNQIPVSVKQQVVNTVPPDQYTPELLDALKNKKWKAARDLVKNSPLIKTGVQVARKVKPVAEFAGKAVPVVGTLAAIEGMTSGISKAAQDPTAENIAYATGKSAAAVLELDPTGITPTIVDTATETFLTKEGRENLKKNADKYDFSTL
tara:strand:+ start:247 stop:1455 length:1209 start_codon:yes stop_codon:yes gene_type:complete